MRKYGQLWKGLGRGLGNFDNIREQARNAFFLWYIFTSHI